MKTPTLLAFMIFISGYALAQECKVLKTEISASYHGDCKNGLAQGKGIAKGLDSYEGEFIKGLPDGTGTYIWANGDNYKGNWKKGSRRWSPSFARTANGRIKKQGHSCWSCLMRLGTRTRSRFQGGASYRRCCSHERVQESRSQAAGNSGVPGHESAAGL